MRRARIISLSLLSSVACGSASSDVPDGAAGARGVAEAGRSGASGSGGAAGSTAQAPGGAGTSAGQAQGGAGGSAPPVGLTLKGSLKTVDALGVQSFDLGVTLSAPSGASTLSHARMFFVHEGGFSYLLGDIVQKSGTFYGVGPDLAAGMSYSLPLQYVWSTPLSHAVLSLAGTVDATPFEVVAKGALLREGFDEPMAAELGEGASIGVRGPLVRVKTLTGATVVPIVAQVVPFTARPFAVSSFTVDVGAGPTAFANPVTVLGIPTYLAVPNSTSASTAVFSATFTIDGVARTSNRTFSVSDVSALPIVPPVKGAWTWRNGPCETALHTHHQYPEQRWAYDILVEKAGASFAGDPKDNTSYHAFDQPFFAALEGKVILADDVNEDNDGSKASAKNPDGLNNDLVIERSDGVRCVYAHLRKGSSKVKLGDVVAPGDELGRVGNAGQSSEPHLHFACFRVDATGRAAALPISLSIGPQSGTPVGGETLTTP